MDHRDRVGFNEEDREMKIQQETLPYRPITIKLESSQEAEAMYSLADKICRCFASNTPVTYDDLSANERQLAVSISDAFTGSKVRI